MTASDYILGIDYGAKRVGVAIAHTIARLPRPLTTLETTDHLVADIQRLITAESIGLVIVGVPRNMDGSESKQSQVCEAFARELSGALEVPVRIADETLSSEEAESALHALGKDYTKADIDAMSATLILERYFDEQGDSSGI
ncbi:Holliday junction resolvase RuvX [Candidatus Saccharibacteria bacterium]|nr:MAG: Holliday junction resolvase RuvX [Candidatus Saccharibacteria bacterium]